MFGPNFRDFVSSVSEDTVFSDIKDERLIKSWHGFEKSDSRDSGNCSENEEVENPVKKAVLTDNSLIVSLIGNIGEGNKSFIIEGNEEESFVTLPKNLTIIEITDILNNAINDNSYEQDNSYEELDKIVNDIDNYGIISVVDLDSENFKSFCLQQLHLNLKERSDHQHIYSNILLPYKINQELKCDYSVKELVLLAIAANDKLTERYKAILFNQENSILLSSLVGGRRYIEIFTEKFPDLYQSLKEQIIKTQCGQVNFFSVIALRNEQAFLQAVLVPYVLKDLIETLQTSRSDPLYVYGVFETASLAQNEPFITMVLDIFEKCADDEIKKDLLTRSIVNLLASAMSQEHVSIVEYLCQRYIRSAGRGTYSIYEQAFADDKVISVLKEQILKNINARSRRKIYDLILKITLDSGNIGFIESLCKKCSECSDDVINYLKQKLKNNEFDNVYESILIALSNTRNKDIVTSVFAYMQIYQENGRNSKDVIRKVIRNILKNAIEEADEIVIALLCDLSCSDQQTPAMQAIYKGEFDTALAIVEEQIEKTSQRLVKTPEAGGVIYNIVQMIPFYGEAAQEEVFADITFVEYCKITAIISTLYRIRGFLQSNTGIQRQANTQVVNATDVLVQEPQQDNNEFLVNSLTEGVMARNKKSGNNKYGKGNNPTSWKGAPTESGKAKAKESQVHNEELLNTQVEPSADVSHAQHIDQEIRESVSDMAVTSTNDQAGASHSEHIDPEIVGLLSDMVKDVSDSQATLGDHEDSSSSERTDTNILVDDCSEDTALLEDSSDEEDHVVEVTNNTHNDGGQPSDPNKNLQDAQKSKWSVVAASGLAIAGIASGLAVAFYLEMLAVGIAVAVLCVIGATFLYCCGPSSELKDNNITEVAATKAPAVS
ncbi:host RNA manipulator TomO [Wolbachia endosymbiont of Folsomia candida]|uniref:host RNA manipulator TomO n=1 Tax=Wolbachia endosymbiont of Folsomia candida TaxID=169402 RepID=UPI000A6AF022|nr:hypothetical protein [Wolbachia endosymbiont of Folsomia candida]APR98046.1 hypothetical protein ASM33_01865 [Wolbachia endosymbiont of Folsomia candida]